MVYERCLGGGRGPEMNNASATRFRALRFASGGAFSSQEMPEVPFYLVGLKRKRKNTHLNSRRNVQKASMALKAGVTGYGCVPGFMGVITYPALEEENNLLNAMRALALADREEAALVDGEVAVVV